MHSSRPPTIKDVAQLAGVAFSTAATALRGDGRVKAETRRKVQAAARKLGYRSNRAAAILASQRTATSGRRELLAYVSHLPPRVAEAEGMIRRRQVAVDAARKLGYAIETCELYGATSPERALHQLFLRGVDGLLLGRFIDSPFSRADLPVDRFAVVAVERFERADPFHSVRANVTEAVRVCYRKLEAAGCRRIAATLRQHEPRMLDDQDRLAAFLECWRGSHGNRAAPPVLLCPMGEFDSIAEWFVRTKADGLITFSNGEYQTLLNNDWRCPEDFRCATLHLPWDSHELDGQIAGVREPVADLTRYALELLDAQLRLRKIGNPPIPVEAVLPVTWVDGQSALGEPAGDLTGK